MTIGTDDFNRANGALTTPWQGAEGNLNVTGNLLVWNASGSNGTWFWNQYTIGPHQFAQCKILNLNGTGSQAGFGVCLRASGVDADHTFYRVVVNAALGSNIAVIRTVSNVSTLLRSFTAVWSNNDVLRAEILGTAIQVFRNGVLLGTLNDSLIASGQPGVAYAATMTNGAINDWSGGDLTMNIQVPSLHHHATGLGRW